MSAGESIFLMYHELSAAGHQPADLDPGYRVYVVSKERFDGQLDWLTSAGLKGVSVSEFCGGATPAGTIVITFDDGCATDLRIAAPALSQRGFTATSFVVTGWIGRAGFMAAQDLRELLQTGIEVGSHAATHRFLSDLSETEIEEELLSSKRALEDILSAPVEHFSCPGGRYDARVLRIAEHVGYRSVSTSAIGFNSARKKFTVFNRDAIYANTDLEQFARICKGVGLRSRQLSYRMRAGMRALLGNQRYQHLRSALLGAPETE